MRETLARLAQASRTFGGGPARTKLALLGAARRLGAVPAPFRLAWHDQVLFCLAYPDDARVRRAAEQELRRIAALIRSRPVVALRTLENSGVAGTWVGTSFSPDLVRWLLAREGRHVSLAWDEANAESVEATLPLFGLPAEADGLLSPDLSTEDWVALAAGRRGALAWLLDRLDALRLNPDLRERVWSTMGLEVRWRLGRASRTLIRFPGRSIHYQRQPLDRHVRLGPVLSESLPPPVQLDRRGVTRLIDAGRAALACRGRETDPITWTNHDETTLFRLDRGIDVALFGLLPGRRLPIESYFGFVAARNRVPVAYGGGWVFFRRCEIGVNLFPEFRGGESARVFAEVLRVYRQHFRVGQFQVDPFQIGRDNPEAIESGAFWFYHRLGFRPTDGRLARLAAAEQQRMASQPGHQTPAQVLRRLAGSRLYLDVAPAERGQSPDLAPWRPAAPSLAAVSLAITRWIGAGHRGDREAAARAAGRELRQRVAPGGAGRTESQRAWFERLAPLAAMVPDLGDWSRAERHQLGRILRAKGGRRERDFALALQRHRRLEAALYAATGAS